MKNEHVANTKKSLDFLIKQLTTIKNKINTKTVGNFAINVNQNRPIEFIYGRDAKTWGAPTGSRQSGAQTLDIHISDNTNLNKILA